MLADLRENGRVRGEGGLAPKTVHNVSLTLHVALESAVKARLIPRNPADDAHKLSKDDVNPDTVAKADVWWSADDMDAFLQHVAGDELYAMWHVFLWTGARRGEVAAMRWSDLDLDVGAWNVTRQWRKGRDGRPSFATLKAAEHGKPNRQRRTVALVPATIEALRRHRAEQAKLMLGEGYQDNGLVFAQPDGQPLHPDGVTQRWDRHVLDSGLRRIRLHDARHSHATWCLAQGMPIHQASRRLGHSSVQITVDTYGHDDIEGQQTALKAALRREAQ
jgi:integrase